jgi:hypothetical protein
MPLIDHDVLFADIAAGDPDDPNDDFAFGMMAEGGTDVCGQQPVLVCVHCDNGTIWCPCSDPQIHQSFKTLRDCLAIVENAMLAAVAIAVAAFLALLTLCVLTPPPASTLCMAGNTIRLAAAVAAALAAMKFAQDMCVSAH